MKCSSNLAVVDLGQGPASPPPPPPLYVAENNLARHRENFAESRGKTRPKQSRRQKEHSCDFHLAKQCCKGEIQRGKAIKWRSNKCLDRPPWRPLNYALSLRRHYVFWLWTEKVCAVYFLKHNTSFEASCSSSWRPKLERPSLLSLNQATVSKKRFKTKKASRRGINNDSSSPGNNFKQLQHPKRVNTSPCSSPERWMQIFVKILAEKTITFEVEPSDHITRSWNDLTIEGYGTKWPWNEMTVKQPRQNH